MPKIYRSVGGVNKEITKQYRGVGGANREIKEQYRGVGGVNREVFTTGATFPILYDNGKENFSIIGGWQNYTGVNANINNSIVKSSSSILLYSHLDYDSDGEYVAMITARPLNNLSSYKYMYVDADAINLGEFGKIVLTTNPADLSKGILAGSYFDSAGRLTRSVGITADAAANPVYAAVIAKSLVRAGSNNTKIQVYKIWLGN